MRRDERLAKAAHKLRGWSMLLTIVGFIGFLIGCVAIAVGFSEAGTVAILMAGAGCVLQSALLLSLASGLSGIEAICDHLFRNSHS